MMSKIVAFALLAVAEQSGALIVEEPSLGHHHKHHHHHHGHHHRLSGHHHVAAENNTVVAAAVGSGKSVTETSIVQRLQALEHSLNSAAQKATTTLPAPVEGKLEVNAPLPADFETEFTSAVADATHSSPNEVRLLGAVPVKGQRGLEEVSFQANPKVVDSVLAQAADPASPLAKGSLHSFLVAREMDAEGEIETKAPEKEEETDGPAPHAAQQAPETDMAMPFGDLEPFGREDTAKDLTEASIRESDAMVDQLERAEVAEEKRAIFRALTRLRGAAITSFDGVARAQTGNVDEYSRANQWRHQHPLNHLANEESDVNKWAFPTSSE